MTADAMLFEEADLVSSYSRAQALADRLAETVYYSAGGADLDPDDDTDIGTPVAPEGAKHYLAGDAMREAFIRWGCCKG